MVGMVQVVALFLSLLVPKSLLTEFGIHHRLESCSRSQRAENYELCLVCPVQYALCKDYETISSLKRGENLFNSKRMRLIGRIHTHVLNRKMGLLTNKIK